MAFTHNDTHLDRADTQRTLAQASIGVFVLSLVPWAWLVGGSDDASALVAAYPWLPYALASCAAAGAAATLMFWTGMRRALADAAGKPTRRQNRHRASDVGGAAEAASLVLVKHERGAKVYVDTVDHEGQAGHEGGGLTLIEAVLSVVIAAVVIVGAVVAFNAARTAQDNAPESLAVLQALQPGDFGMVDDMAIHKSQFAKQGARFAFAYVGGEPLFCALMPDGAEYLLRTTGARNQRLREIAPNPVQGLCTLAVEDTYARARAAAGIAPAP